MFLPTVNIVNVNTPFKMGNLIMNSLLGQVSFTFAVTKLPVVTVLWLQTTNYTLYTFGYKCIIII